MSTGPMLSPREAAMAAAEARSRAPAPPVSSAATAHSDVPFVPSRLDKLAFHRLIDTELMPKTSIPQRVRTFDLLVQVTSNVLHPPIPQNSAKYKRLRLANSKIKRDLVDVPGAYDYLIQAGFRSVQEEFEDFLIFPPAPRPMTLHSLRVAHHVLSEVLVKARADEERGARFKNSEQEAERARVGRALLGFEEDRRLKREKDDRDKIVRDSRAAEMARLENGEMSAEEISARHESERVIMDVDDDAPPSYGYSGGRVLGTGAEVLVEPDLEGVDFSNLQDRHEL